MSGWRDMIFGAIAKRVTDGSSEGGLGETSITETAAQRKRLLIAGGVGVAIVAAIIGIWLWQRHRAKAGKTPAARKSNPSIRVKKAQSRRAKRKARKSKSSKKAATEEAPRKAPRKPARKPSKKLKDVTEIQTLIFSKSKFDSADEAKSWAADHDFKTTKVDETGQSFRLRQHVPGLYGPRSFRTITLTDGIKGVVARRKQAA